MLPLLIYGAFLLITLKEEIQSEWEKVVGEMREKGKGKKRKTRDN